LISGLVWVRLLCNVNVEH